MEKTTKMSGNLCRLPCNVYSSANCDKKLPFAGELIILILPSPISTGLIGPRAHSEQERSFQIIQCLLGIFVASFKRLPRCYKSHLPSQNFKFDFQFDYSQFKSMPAAF